jgi:hypothetical protein
MLLDRITEDCFITFATRNDPSSAEPLLSVLQKIFRCLFEGSFGLAGGSENGSS